MSDKFFEYTESSQIKDIFADNQLGTFDQLWELEAPWFEEPNYRRGGWSGVVKYQLSNGKKPLTVFIKRQEGHNYRNFKHPIEGLPTFYREYKNLLLLKEESIPTLRLITYQHRRCNGKWQSILVTESLEGFRDLSHLGDKELYSTKQRHEIIKAAGQLVCTLHSHGLHHFSLYPKHLMFNYSDTETLDIRFIDLEKMRKALLPNHASVSDFSRLLKRSNKILSNEERELLVSSYLDNVESVKAYHYLHKRICPNKR